MLPSSKKPGTGVRFLGSVAVRSGKIPNSGSKNGCRSSTHPVVQDPSKQNGFIAHAHPSTSGTK